MTAPTIHLPEAATVFDRLDQLQARLAERLDPAWRRTEHADQLRRLERVWGVLLTERPTDVARFEAVAAACQVEYDATEARHALVLAAGRPERERISREIAFLAPSVGMWA